MSRTLSAVSTTTLGGKYGVGDIAEFVGVPAYYDAGDSQWAQSNTWIPAASIGSATAKSNIRSSSYNNVAITDNSALLGFAQLTLNSVTPLAKTASVVSLPITTDTTNCKVLTIAASGVRMVATGQAQGYANAAGGANLVTSDGTTLWSWTAASASAWGAYTSTDGITWTTASLSGQATFSSATTYPLGPTGAQSSMDKTGEQFVTSGTYLQVAAYCGARHLLIGLNGSNQYIAQRSTNGLAWGGDESTTILGSGTVAATAYGWWYRNGNTFFIAIGNVVRKSTDGGATWAAATNAIAAASTTRYRVNASDATRIACCTNSSTAMAFSADSGATWTTRTAPFTLNANTTLNGRGSSWVLCDTTTGNTYKSTDDGATWSVLATPTGFSGTVQGVYADANRWYIVSAVGNNVATSTDLSTWTVRNISNTAPGTNYNYSPVNLVATDSNTIMGANISGYVLVSADGGVTWYWTTYTNSSVATGGGAVYLVANSVGLSTFIAGQMSVTYSAYTLASDVAALGKAYRVTSTTITPLRANSLAFARIS